MKNVERLVIPGVTDLVTLTCIARARKLSQYTKAVADALACRCPFCTPDPDKNPRISLSAGAEHWYVTPCNPPEDFTKLHLLIIPIQKFDTGAGLRHVRDSRELNKEAWAQLQDVNAEISDRFNAPYRGWQCRDGDARESVGTIEHLHIHVMVGDGSGRVASPLSKTDAEEEESLKRAIIFEKIRQGTKPEDLPPEEFALVEKRL